MSSHDGGDASVTLLEQAPDAPGKKEKDTPKKDDVKLIGVLGLFRYANTWERLMMFTGFIFNLASGIPFPFFLIIWGESFDSFMQLGKLNNFLPTIPEYLESNNLTDLEVVRDPSILDQSRCANINSFYGGNITCTVSLHEGIYDKMTEMAVYYCLLGVNTLVSGYLGTSMWLMAAEKQANRIRRSCLYNVLSQNIGWFDTHNASELNNRLLEDIVKIQDGMGDKMGSFIQWISAGISCFVVGFYYGWKFALVVLAVSPLMFAVVGSLNKLSASFVTGELTEYAKAGGIAEEVFGAIKTVVAFGGQEKEAERYYKNLDSARRYGIKRSMVHGVTVASFNLALYSCKAFSFWYGGKLHRDEPDNYSPDKVLIVFASIMASAFAFGNCVPSIQALSTARGAAFEVFKLIELKMRQVINGSSQPEKESHVIISNIGIPTAGIYSIKGQKTLTKTNKGVLQIQKSPIDSMSEKGTRPDKLKGIIEFKGVDFAYPARPDVKVLNDVNLQVLPGQTVALVGASGCGKSTTVQLLLRFYDPDHGKILIDGCDIRNLNVKWLRKNIGLVSQEPVLFATTIAENIRYGRGEVTRDELIAAAKNANAYDFIMQLPNQFETFVGERGAQLSGGQKQRIAIARALVRDPKILLLDEATSSLDTESESIVQDALDKASEGRTTFIIAHRLSTIKNADVIIGIENGQIIETGTHNELMEHRGIYYQLVMNQIISKDEENDEDFLGENMDLELTSNGRKDQNLSVSESGKMKEVNEDDDEKNLPKLPILRLFKMNAPEWYFIALGCIGSIGAGCVTPAFVLTFSEVLSVFSEDEETQKDEFVKYAIFLVCLGFINLFTGFLQTFMFGLSGETLTTRIRDQTFRAMLKQDIAWYDDPKNVVGALTTRLSTDASQVQGVTGVRIGVALMSLSCITGCLIIAFISGWKFTLVLLGFMPFFAVGDFVKVKLFAGQAAKNKESFEDAGKITVETLGNIRTVASLSKEKTFYSLYVEKIKGPYQRAMRNAHIVGLTYGYSQTTIYFFYACAFVFGAYMVEEDEMSTKDFFRVLCALMFGSMGLGNASAFAPDLGKAQVSAKRIIHILDSKPSKDLTNSAGKKLTLDYSATVSFKDVNFHYISRQNVPVLQDLNLSVSPGQTMALVGSSGCGKSTSVHLIERFYDTVSGSVCLDSHDIKTLNIEWLRSQMALVSQEPILFDRTIGENIAFGDNSRDVPMEEIVQAARTANIHNFITSLPKGYDTNIGTHGSQLSGGQKQRIAIARALVRNPRILLLDEATSSLDTESEKVVQEALDKARAGRTCVTIAHRLATVQNADRICVIRNGTVTEEGTHSELMAMKGFYKKLVEKSMRPE